MKKTLSILLSLCCVSLAHAASVDSETNYQGSSITHTPGDSADFAITFELSGINDISELATPGSGPVLFTWDMTYSNGEALNVQAMYGQNTYWSLYIKGDTIGSYFAMAANSLSNPNGTYIFQFEDETCEFTFGILDEFDTIQPIISSKDIISWGTTFEEAYTNNYADATMEEGSITIDPVNAGEETVGTVMTWSGTPTASEIVEASKPVPEPATATLSLLALVGLAARRRR